MLVSTMIDRVLSLTLTADITVLAGSGGSNRNSIMQHISTVQQDWAERTLRFTKKGYCNSRYTTDERNGMEYNLVRRAGATSGGLPFDFLSVIAVTYDGYPLTPGTVNMYMAARAQNGGDAQWNIPKFYWVVNNVLHLWPVPNESNKKIWALYAARPQDIAVETESIQIPDLTALQDGVMARVYNILKDTERATYFQRIYEERIRSLLARAPIEATQWSPFVDGESSTTWSESVRGGVFGG